MSDERQFRYSNGFCVEFLEEATHEMLDFLEVEWRESKIAMNRWGRNKPPRNPHNYGRDLLDGMTLKAIAKKYGITIESVRDEIKRLLIRIRLQKKINEEILKPVLIEVPKGEQCLQ